MGKGLVKKLRCYGEIESSTFGFRKSPENGCQNFTRLLLRCRTNRYLKILNEDGLNPITEECEGVNVSESVPPEGPTNSGNESLVADVGSGFLETSNHINGFDDTPKIVEEVMEDSEVNGEFIPGNLFNFEKVLETDVGILDNGNVLNKRKKKSLLGTMGRPNPAFSSSLEKTKVGKKPKCNEDLFWLDPLLGLDNDIVALDKDLGNLHGADEADRGDHSVQGEANDLDLNSHPINNEGVDLVSSDVMHNTSVENNVHIQDEEMEATIALGEKLGANLHNSHGMIQDSIIHEGLQGGKK
ncbi:hypothetical protein HanRHA438_Chr01g0013681 [Helianthus annuus]|nr:hypothetical protein HanRHA438_Chr01g0013681 [Helianthus annuus]